MSDFVSERAVLIRKKSMRGVECFSMVLEVGEYDEAFCIFIFTVLEEW